MNTTRAALSVLQWLVSAGFLLLAVAALRTWARQRHRADLHMAAAIGLLALTALAGRVAGLVPGAALAINDVAVVMLMASAYAMLLFRSDFIPIRPIWRRIIGAFVALIALAFLFGGGSAGVAESPLQQALTAALVLTWSACIAEPLWRFAAASRHRPAVQRSRLRALAAGYFALVVVLLVAGFAGRAAQSTKLGIATQAVALLSIPLIYAGFVPPQWLRRLWREGEEEALRGATQDLVLYSPNRRLMAERAAEWAARLTGAQACVIANLNGEVLAAHGVDPDRGRDLALNLDVPDGEPIRTGPRETAVRFQLDTDPAAVLLVLAGPFTPFFGMDEIARLRQYAVNTTAGLDRAGLTERITLLERTKTEFLNLASHELRGPVTLLRGYFDMMETGALGDVQPELQSVLPTLIGAADQMNLLVEQMLEASRLEEGRLELRKQVSDLAAIVRRAVDRTLPITDSAHPIEFDKPAQEIQVIVDPERVTTIVTNLLSNAIKYSPAGGEIRCRIAVDTNAAVEIEDHGVGIAPADQPRIFTRFGRVTTPATRNVPGTGLGLYLSRELARLHGGDLTFRSRPGVGTTFRLTLPRAQT